jgi:hypothetical protein
MKCSLARLKRGMVFLKSCARGELNANVNLPFTCKSCDVYHSENMKLTSEVHVCDDFPRQHSLACDDLAFDDNLLKSNISMLCNSYVSLNDDLDKVRNKIAWLEASVSLPCVSCESLLAEINEI